MHSTLRFSKSPPMHVWVQGAMCMYGSVWRSEIDLGCSSFWAIHLIVWDRVSHRDLVFSHLGWCLAIESRESFCPYLLVLGLQAFATMPGFICGCWGSCSCHTHIMWSLESLDRALLYYLHFSTWGETRLPKATCFSASFRLWPSAFLLFYLPKTSKQSTSHSKTKTKNPNIHSPKAFEAHLYLSLNTRNLLGNTLYALGSHYGDQY